MGGSLIFLCARLEFDTTGDNYPGDRIVNRYIHHQLHDAAIVEEPAQRFKCGIANFDVARRFCCVANYRTLILIEFSRRFELRELLQLPAPDAEPSAIFQ